MNNIKMVYYDIIDVSEGIDVNKTSESKECDICHYCYFLDKAFKFQSDFWNGFQGVLIMSMNLSNIAILNIQGVDYRCIISEISKSEVINLMRNVQLSEKRKIINYKNYKKI